MFGIDIREERERVGLGLILWEGRIDVSLAVLSCWIFVTNSVVKKKKEEKDEEVEMEGEEEKEEVVREQ